MDASPVGMVSQAALTEDRAGGMVKAVIANMPGSDVARRMILNERSGEEVAFLAGRLFDNPEVATPDEVRRLAGSVLSQRRLPVARRGRVESVDVRLHPPSQRAEFLFREPGGRTTSMSIDNLQSFVEWARWLVDKFPE